MICLANYGLNTIIVKQDEVLKRLNIQCWFFWWSWQNKVVSCCLHITKRKKIVVACRNINNIFIDHSFAMLAVSFQLLTWCTDSAEDLIIFYLPQLMSIKTHNNCSFVFRKSLGQQQSAFLIRRPVIYSWTLTIYVQPNSLDGSLIRNVHINLVVQCSSFLFKANCICSWKLIKAI